MASVVGSDSAEDVRSGFADPRVPEGSIGKYGDGSGNPVWVTVNNKKTARTLVLNPDLAFGEAYTSGGLDIGCGWRGMALELARAHWVDVLGIPLSSELLQVAKKRAAREGLNDPVDFRLCDYRDIGGSFDGIVSVGIFEHVGPPHYATFFKTLRDLYDERILLMWRFYLAACEQTFRHGRQAAFQIQLSRTVEAVPLTRDYLFALEPQQAALSAAE